MSADPVRASGSRVDTGADVGVGSTVVGEGAAATTAAVAEAALLVGSGSSVLETTAAWLTTLFPAIASSGTRRLTDEVFVSPAASPAPVQATRPVSGL